MTESSAVMSVSSHTDTNGSDSESDVEIIEETKDFMEVYSPPRVFFAATRLNLKTHMSLSFDLEKGFDFQTLGARAECLRAVETWAPLML